MDLSGTAVSDLSPLQGLIHLELLSLGATQVSEISLLVPLTALQNFSLCWASRDLLVPFRR